MFRRNNLKTAKRRMNRIINQRIVIETFKKKMQRLKDRLEADIVMLTDEEHTEFLTYKKKLESYYRRLRRRMKER